MAPRPTNMSSGGDFWAVYDDDGKLWFHRVAVFIISQGEDEENWAVEGIDVASLNEGMSDYCSTANNFLGYVHRDDFEVLGAKLKEGVRATLRGAR